MVKIGGGEEMMDLPRTVILMAKQVVVVVEGGVEPHGSCLSSCQLWNLSNVPFKRRYDGVWPSDRLSRQSRLPFGHLGAFDVPLPSKYLTVTTDDGRDKLFLVLICPFV